MNNKKKWQIGWGPISQCNMKCAFCYSANTRENINDLKFDDWIKFIDTNYQYIESINYGTGENTLSSEWFELIKYIRNCYPEIIQALTSNGFLSYQMANNEYFKRIVLDSIDEVDISLDFCDEKKHSEFRGQENAYKWAIKSLEFCMMNKIPATIVFVATNETLQEDNIHGLFEIAKQYGAKLRMNIYRPTNLINERSKRFIPSFKMINNFLQLANKHYKILAICDPLFSAIFTDDEIRNDPSGINSIRILSDGSITPSTYLISDEFREYNIRQDDVLKYMQEHNAFEVFKAPVMPDGCKGCSYINTCRGGVFDRRYLWYKTFDERDPYCPFRDENFLPEKKVKIYKDDTFHSVHDGYLPTMFFSY